MFISHAQNFEDVMLYRLFKDKKSGFYIDVGANHPVFESVTKSFYDRGWRGINIEPVPEFFTLLQQQRERDINLNIAVGDKESELEFFELQGSGYSTFDEEEANKLAQENDLNLSEYKVKVRPLADICRKYVNCSIDFLKIDVEGWEEQVIASNDWDNFRPTVIIVETTLPGSPIRKKTNIANFLQTKGYQQVYFDGLNDYYLAEEASSLSSCFDLPPNVFDNFVPFQVVDLHAHAENLEELVRAREAEIDNLKKIIEERQRQIVILTNHLDDERFETKRLTEALRQIQENKKKAIAQHEAQLLQQQKAISHYRDRLALYETQFLQQKEAIDQYQNQITQTKTQLFNQNNPTDSNDYYQKQLAELQIHLFNAQQRVVAMETSKFWKMRKVWFRFRKALGISGD